MARPRVAASPLLLLLSPAAALALALAALALAPAPAASAASAARATSLQEQQQQALEARPPGGETAWAASGAGRERRSPREEMAEQQDETESVDPNQKKPGFFKRIWQKMKEMVKKGLEILKQAAEAVGEIMNAFDQGSSKTRGGGGGGGGGSEDNAETMSPDRLESEPQSGE